MKFGPLSKDAKEKPYIVFDIESRPKHGKGFLRCNTCERKHEPLSTDFIGAGIYDGECYTYCGTRQKLLAEILSDKYKGHIIYAHNGSGYDFLFLLDDIIQAGVEFKAYKTGSRIFINVDGRQIIDSMAVMKFSLDKSCEALGINYRKPNLPKDFYCRIEKYDWRPYMKNDCVMLYEVIRMMRASIAALGGQLKPTLASTAMHLFRRHYMDTEFDCVPHFHLAELAARVAYAGGRCEVFKENMGKGASFDINSSYPHAMLKPVPTEFKGAWRDNPKRPPKFSICLATVDIPHDEYAPPLFHRYKGKLMFPTGRWQSWFTWLELEYCQKKYGTNAVKIHTVIEYKSHPLFKKFIQAMWKERKAAKARGNQPMDLASKLIMNSLYGKTGMGRLRNQIISDERYEKWPLNSKRDTRAMSDYAMRFPDRIHETRKQVYNEDKHIYAIPQIITYAPYIQPQIAATITARGRLNLQGFIDRASNSLVYTDTDSLYCIGRNSARYFSGDLGDEIGQLKKEHTIDSGFFPYPKCYVIRDSNTGEFGAAKGVARNSAQIQKVKAFLKGKAVEQIRITGLLESLRHNGEIVQESKIALKQLHNIAKKRLPNRAFRLDELQ